MRKYIFDKGCIVVNLIKKGKVMIQLLFENNRNLSLIFCGKNKKRKKK